MSLLKSRAPIPIAHGRTATERDNRSSEVSQDVSPD
jgi:hypothetical protein